MKMLEDRASPEGLLTLSEEEMRSVRRNVPISEVYDVEDIVFARGKFATVRRASHKTTGVQYAAKYIKKRRRAVDMTPEIYHEICVLLKCASNSRVVRLHEVYESNSDMVLVLELAAGGELQRIFDGDQCLGEIEARRAMRQILEGLCFLHERNIAHLDLKPQNLLLTTEDCCDDIKLCDFGVSRLLAPGTEVRAILGTPDYVAPEVLSYEPISLATDIWSVGVLAYVLLSGYTPFGADSKQQTYLNISKAIVTFEPDHFVDVSNAALDFIKSILIVNARQRPTVQDLLQHPWISQKSHILPSLTLKSSESISVTPKSTPISQRKSLPCSDTPTNGVRSSYNTENMNGFMEDIVYIGPNDKVCSSEIIYDSTDSSEKYSAGLNNDEALSNGTYVADNDAIINCDSDEACAETSTTKQLRSEEMVEEEKLNSDNQTINSEQPNLEPQFQEKEKEVFFNHAPQYIVAATCEEDYKFDHKTNMEMLKDIKQFETETVEDYKIFDAANNLHQPKEDSNFAEFAENHEEPDETLRLIEMNEIQQLKADAEDESLITEAANGDDQFQDEIQLQDCNDNNDDVENVSISETEQDEIQKEEEKANGDDLKPQIQEEIQPIKYIAESEEIKNGEKELDETQEVEDKEEVINECRNLILEIVDSQLRDEDESYTNCVEEHKETSSPEGKIIKIIDAEFEVDSKLPTNSKTKCVEEQNFNEKTHNEIWKPTEFHKE